MGVSIWEGGKAERAAAALEAIAETFDVIDDTSGAGDTDVTWSADKIAEELEGKLDGTLKGASGGLAELDANGKVPSSQLPSYVDDVLEYASLSTFPQTGESGKIYISLNDNKTYRWGGSAYTEISQSLALGENSSTAYRGDKGAAAYAAAVTNVDSTPTENSTHLVTSGAVYAGLDEKADKTDVVTDVQVNGTSVVTSGVANVQMASGSNPGVVKVSDSASFGISMRSDGNLQVEPSSDGVTKAGEETRKPIVPYRQHISAFYGLAKAAGDSTQVSSSNPVGTYTDNAKSAIRTMIGAGTSSISDVQVNGTSVLNNGVANIPFASGSRLGVIKTGTGNGIYVDSTNGEAYVSHATDEQVKSSNGAYRPIVPNVQHASVFYGLAKAAGDTSQASSSNVVGAYTDDAKTAIRTMIGAGTYSKPSGGIPSTDLASGVIPSVPVTDVQVNGSSVLNNGVANVPLADTSTYGVMKIGYGLFLADNMVQVERAATTSIKAGTDQFCFIRPSVQHASVFYGLAKAAGEDMASSSNAVGTYTDAAKSAIRTMIGAGTYSKPSTGIPASDLASGVIPSVPVTDVQVNGTSVLNNGVANIPMANGTTVGVITVSPSISATGLIDDVDLAGNSYLKIYAAPTQIIKLGSNEYMPITSSHQHESTFYGLAKAAGDSTQAASSNAVGTYTDDAKSAIRTMIGAGTPIDVQIDGTSIVNNGVATIPIATTGNYGIFKVETSHGFSIYNGSLMAPSPDDATIKAGTNGALTLKPSRQHVATFYGLAKAAGDTTQSQSSNAVGTYTDDAKSAIRTMLGAGTYSKPANGIPASDLASGVIPSVPVTDVQINGTSIISNGVATIPIADSSNPGVVRINANGGTQILSSGTLALASAGETLIKAGTSQYKPITPLVQHMATFYGLATAAGDTTQSQSSNAVGTYTAAAKTAIKTMLGVTDLPSVTSSDNGKVLMVVNGAWAVVSLSSANGVSF